MAARKTQRRNQLLAAAIHIYGQAGYHNATVKAVCDAAGLTERYFYESFANSEALLLAVYDHVNRQLIEGIRSVSDATPGSIRDKALAALTYYFTALQLDPKIARIFLIELSGISPEVDLAQSANQQAFAGLFLQHLDPEAALPAAKRDLLAHAAVGGITSIALFWIRDGHSRPIPELVAAALDVCELLSPFR